MTAVSPDLSENSVSMRLTSMIGNREDGIVSSLFDAVTYCPSLCELGSLSVLTLGMIFAVMTPSSPT